MDLVKLTVPQLRALCKDRKLAGYSKLNKQALVAKLQQNEGSCFGAVGSTTSAANVTLPSTTAPAAARNTPPSVSLTQATDSGALTHEPDSWTTSRSDVAEQNPFEKNLILPGTGPAGLPNTTSPSGERSRRQGRDVDKRPSLPAAAQNCALSAGPSAKRKNEVASENMNRKRLKTGTSSTTAKVLAGFTQIPSKKSLFTQPNQAFLNPIVPSKPLTVLRALTAGTPTALEPTSNLKLVPTFGLPTPRNKKTFAPLVPKLLSAKLQLPVVSPGAGQSQSPIVAERHLQERNYSGVPSSFGADSALYAHLFFAPSDALPVTLRPISLPPSISQRKKVQRISLILSLLFQDNLSAFGRLSRLYRYSAYVAASHKLRREFSGRRLDDMFKKYSPNMINFWPYLRQRRKEGLDKKSLFLKTFLGRATEEYPSIICDGLWSPDYPKQILIAVRFILTCFYYRVSIGVDVGFDQMTILSADEVIEGEIWKITLRIASVIHYYYVLEATCEVVGLPSVSSELREAPNPDRRSSLIRADWTNYIQENLKSSGDSCLKKIRDHLSWPNHEEYELGISKNWLRCVEKQGDIGASKFFIARRYVFACLVANSLSGRLMTSVEMEQDFDGSPMDQSVVFKPKERPNLSLFLPSHHLVESVHTKSQRGVPLHPAVAVVQTPGREYYILRDNGMQIGCEEDGVSMVWMDILLCDENGVVKIRNTP